MIPRFILTTITVVTMNSITKWLPCGHERTERSIHALRHALSGRPRAGGHRRALDDLDSPRPAPPGAQAVPGFRALPGRHQPQYPVGTAEAARGGRYRRAPLL